MSMLDDVEDCGCVVSNWWLYIHVGRCTEGHVNVEGRELVKRELERRELSRFKLRTILKVING